MTDLETCVQDEELARGGHAQKERGGGVARLHHGGAQELVAQAEATAELAQDGAVGHVVLLLAHDRLVQLRVEGRADARHGLHAQASERLHHLLVQALCAAPLASRMLPACCMATPLMPCFHDIPGKATYEGPRDMLGR